MDLIRAVGAHELAEDSGFIDQMRRSGATGSATACAHRDLPRLPRERFNTLVKLGVLREAAPGFYYLFEEAESIRSSTVVAFTVTPSRLIRRVLFWLAAILIPVAFLQWRG